MWGRLQLLAMLWIVALCSLSWASRAQSDGLRGARVIEGALAPAGEMLTAGPEGATLALEFGARLRAEPGATFRFDKFMKLPMGSGPDPMVPARVLTLELGHVTASIPDDRRFAVLMIGPRKLRAILSEGRATVIATEERAAAATLAGKVLVTVADRWRHLPEGSIQIVSRAFPTGYRRTILTAPGAPTLSRSLLLEGVGEASTTTAYWPALPGAVQYEIELSREGGQTPFRQRTREARVALGPFDAGTYRMTVRGLDDSGMPGADSQPTTLNVVGLDIPKTASRAQSGAVRLQPGQRVGLLGADGLEVGYLGMDEFLPAPKTLGLVARRPISTLLRHPGSGETVRLELQPMTVRAHIEFEKHPHAWPPAGLPITVHLVDEQGYPIPDDFQVSFRVTVNVRPVAPEWQRSGPVLSTSLPRPEQPGPWMVRVEVLDESGGSLGMDFSEVAYEPAPSQARQSRR